MLYSNDNKEDGASQSPLVTRTSDQKLTRKKKSQENAADRIVREVTEPQLNMDIVGNYESEAHQEDSSVERCSAVEAGSLSSNFSRTSPQHQISPNDRAAGTRIRKPPKFDMEQMERANHLENQLS